MRKTSVAVFLFLVCALRAWAARPLEVYFIDVEGGQATFVVSPSGQSLLIDTGWPDAKGRDAERIVAAAKLAGLDRIDYLLITHYHMDHVGGVPQLAARIPLRTFLDHGPSVESGKDAAQLFADYQRVRDKGKHQQVKPGDRIPIKGIDVQVLTAADEEITEPLPGAGGPNPFCASVPRHENDPSENAQSVGILITFGKFRMIDLGDLTWNKELELVCPNNKVGSVDVYLSTHHGMNLSGAPAIVHALHPRVAVINNGARKGGSPEAWDTIRSSPGIKDIWQLHYSVAGETDHNAPDPFIANVGNADDVCRGNWIKLTADGSGLFTLTNSRNGKMKIYKPAP